MASNFIQEGDVMPWTNNTGAAVANGQVVVVGSLLAIAMVNIAVGEQGSLALDDVWEVPKVSGAVIAQGEWVNWNASAAAFDDNAATPAAGDVTQGAVAFESAGAGITSLKILLIRKPGVLAA